jgi:hypothetical protein
MLFKGMTQGGADMEKELRNISERSVLKYILRNNIPTKTHMLRSKTELKTKEEIAYKRKGTTMVKKNKFGIKQKDEIKQWSKGNKQEKAVKRVTEKISTQVDTKRLLR